MGPEMWLDHSYIQGVIREKCGWKAWGDGGSRDLHQDLGHRLLFGEIGSKGLRS